MPKTPPANQDSPLKTIPEASAYLKVSRAKLYTMLPELQTVRLGGRRLVLKDSLDALIERSKAA